MKKFLTALIAFVMCFSVVTTAFAATPDEASDFFTYSLIFVVVNIMRTVQFNTTCVVVV